jgi:ubiquinone/menaquinone biosynthesis C-methylase UbiE
MIVESMNRAAIDANGGERLVIGGKDWWRRPQPELVSTPLGALAPGSRLKLLSNSKHVYEVDAVDEQVVYHHVDIATLNQQRLESNTSVFTVPNGADLLSDSEPVRGFHLGVKDPKFFEQATHSLTNMTRRGLTDYVEKLEIPPGELASPDHRILDIGAGAQQELARDAKAAGLRGHIISIDPGLALDEEKDLSRINYSMDKAYRMKGRNHSQPLTIAANGEALPFADQSADAAYAMFSIPYWAKDATQVGTFLSEMGRVVKPGGYGRVYPVKEAQTSIVERWLAENGLNTKSELKFKPPNVGKGPLNRYIERDDYYLLTMRY